MTFFGAGAPYFDAVAKSGVRPARALPEEPEGVRLDRLAPLGAAFEWLYAKVKDDLWVASISGGTDLCTAFVGGCPTLPVRSGLIQCRYLGAAVAGL